MSARPPLRVLILIILGGGVCTPPAAAQEAEFVAGVRELIAVGGSGAGERGSGNGDRPSAVIQRMRAALREWDRGIRAREAQVEEQLKSAASDRAFQLHVELGFAYRRRGRFDEALRQFDVAAALQPAASDVHLLRALTLEAAGRGGEAGGAFHAAWNRDAGNPVKAYLVLSRVRDIGAADRERAHTVLRDAYRRALSTDRSPESAPFLVLDLVPDASSPRPVAGDARLAGVFARLAAGRLDDAVAAFEEGASAAAAVDAQSAVDRLGRARTAETEGRLGDARREYRSALSGTLSGRHALHVGIGRIAQVEGDLDGAIEAFAHAARLSPNDPVIRRELAAASLAAGRPDEAFAELVAALLIAPRDADVLVAIGQLYLDTDRAEEAIPPFRRALAVKADRYQTHYALAQALARAGRADEAGREFERFERLSREAMEKRRRSVAGEAPQ